MSRTQMWKEILRAVAKAQNDGRDLNTAAKASVDMASHLYHETIEELHDEGLVEAKVQKNGAGIIKVIFIDRITSKGRQVLEAEEL